MTPKEKAQELVDKYLCIDEIYDVDLFCDECGMTNDVAKYCALIAVDEILKLNHPIVIVYTETSNNLIEQYTQEYYWEQVKHEIQKI